MCRVQECRYLNVEMDHPWLDTGKPNALVKNGEIDQSEQMKATGDVGLLPSALVFRLWHLRYFVLPTFADRDRGYHGLDLILSLTLSLLQEIPKGIDENIVGSDPLVSFSSPDLVNPAYGRSVFSGQANRGALGMLRDVFLFGAHESHSY